MIFNIKGISPVVYFVMALHLTGCDFFPGDTEKKIETFESYGVAKKVRLLTIKRDRLFLAEKQYLNSYSLIDPGKPELLLNVSLGMTVKDLIASEERMLVTGETKSVQFSLSESGNLIVFGPNTYITSGSPMAMTGTRLFQLTGGNLLTTNIVVYGNNSEVVAAQNVYGKNLVCAQNNLWVISGQEILWFDLTRFPATPELVSKRSISDGQFICYSGANYLFRIGSSDVTVYKVAGFSFTEIAVLY